MQRGTLSPAVITLLSQRDHFMNEIEAQRSRAGMPVALYSKAGTLLTRFWARANWPEREDILKTVRWLLNLAKIQSSQPSANGRSGKTKRSRSQLKMAAPLPAQEKARR